MSSPPPSLRRSASVPAVGEGQWFGLYPATDFVLGRGDLVDGRTSRQGRWYFREELVAAPKPALALPEVVPGLTAQAELRGWLANRTGILETYPPLVWVAAPEVVGQARLDADGTRLLAADGSWKLTLAPQLPLNRCYFNETSAAWFRQRPLRVRGTVTGDAVIVRTFWPKDFRLPRDSRRAQMRALPTTPEAIQALVRAEPNGGASSPFSALLLWQRTAAAYAVPSGRAVLALIVNGAQGDDDEAHGGHFAVITGRTAVDGSIADWLVNNFYSLECESEKGIIAAPVPLDNYLADLNSGQGYYRPSAMLVAVLASERAAALVQDAFNRIYVQFYRHRLVYDHANMNCAGISVDVLRALGLAVRRRGPAARVRAAVGLPWLLWRERSVKKACAIYDYLTEDQTRLMPAAAFEDIGAELVGLAARGAEHVPATNGALPALFAQDVESLFFMRFPQFPSARALGNAPVVTPFEYRSRWPRDPKAAQIIPLPPRPFPPELRDPDWTPAPTARSERALAIWAALSVIGWPWLLWRKWRGRTTQGA